MRLDSLHIDLCEFFVEEFAVLGVHDSLDRGTEYLNIIFLKYASLVKIHTTVERGLASECKENALWGFLLDDLLHKICSHRKEIYLVGNLLRSLDCSDVRVDEDSLDTLLLECLECL